mmetsp:Transcript_9192/g.30307  ORF Transcript_9192/g.30307 Transcript_9192/m.30307 type:complete len:265 (+) Transcript_9192:383-1177(+)
MVALELDEGGAEPVNLLDGFDDDSVLRLFLRRLLLLARLLRLALRLLRLLLLRELLRQAELAAARAAVLLEPRLHLLARALLLLLLEAASLDVALALVLLLLPLRLQKFLSGPNALRLAQLLHLLLLLRLARRGVPANLLRLRLRLLLGELLFRRGVRLGHEERLVNVGVLRVLREPRHRLLERVGPRRVQRAPAPVLAETHLLQLRHQLLAHLRRHHLLRRRSLSPVRRRLLRLHRRRQTELLIVLLASVLHLLLRVQRLGLL